MQLRHPFTLLPTLYSFTILILALAGLSACGGHKPPYPPATAVREAPQERLEFVNAFLQGRWCEAARQFEAGQDSYIRSDNVCQVARNYVLAWKLKSYAQIDEPELLTKARKYRELGFGCQNNAPIPEPGGSGTGERDSRFGKLIAVGDFAGVHEALKSEEDPLYASVYGRKAAAAALAAGHKDLAAQLVEQAREVDSRHGWVVLLREDWRFASKLAENADKQALIAERIKLLEKQIQPCTP